MLAGNYSHQPDLNLSLGDVWIAKDTKFSHAKNEDSDQTARMCRLIGVSVGCNIRRYVFSPSGSYVLVWFKWLLCLLV